MRLDHPLVMGILNITPDSFHAGSRVSLQEVVDRAGTMLHDGAAILDLGGYSSRPGATDITLQEEADRVLPSMEAVCKAFPDVICSIDTFRANIAEQAIQAGASIINDISSGDDDPDMIPLVTRLHVPYILMHKQGKPATMQQQPEYANVVLEVMDYLAAKTTALTKAGVADLIIDPGFGFGKTLEHNLALFQALGDFRIFPQPLMVGISRKRMISMLTGAETADALNGTTVLHTIALQRGARILRVHDVKEAVECVKLVTAVNGTL